MEEHKAESPEREDEIVEEPAPEVDKEPKQQDEKENQLQQLRNQVGQTTCNMLIEAI